MNISVIGAGQMGNGIAHVFAQNGHSVVLIDVAQAALDKALVTVRKNLDRQLAKGSLTEDAKAATLKNITTSIDLAKGVSKAELVVEAATENVELPPTRARSRSRDSLRRRRARTGSSVCTS